MARNEEKAQALLNRFLTSKQEARRGPSKTRPHVATECKDLNEADKWRQQVLREIGKKVMEIQNAGLGEYRYKLEYLIIIDHINEHCCLFLAYTLS